MLSFVLFVPTGQGRANFSLTINCSAQFPKADNTDGAARCIVRARPTRLFCSCFCLLLYFHWCCVITFAVLLVYYICCMNGKDMLYGYTFVSFILPIAGLQQWNLC